ncbi:transcriptional regulator (Cupin domain/ Helix-turn-helix.) [Methanocella conradii HZ254]|uniref:Transcriptional regulator (Cupin domain/ Helix-turn-helix.) n=1 Tax=Methanocella conradii (strain DSM 24694 / JCM 17849 / CGMCC 1.5162 / HZ254) TaxID=1041930 RepID=H8I4P8_METCZ|nr:cupin domain-containing protein [Methanocella conradii]AFD00643.1 transcriptional regulator (Cupin domain/ Helix-turn-helix.) [Methanocella conradii HZ254]MDI6896341.1 cupin domain-containing protein [Methanocella conradii]
MQERIKEVADRIKELRNILGISIDDMSGYLKVGREKYLRYENGEEDIPASVLYEISRKLGVEMSILLTGETPRMHYFTVTRKGKGVSVERRKQYKYQSLAANFINKKAEPFIVTVDPNKTEVQTNSHPGQEFNYILEGSLKLIIRDNEIVLNEGDSIYFDSSCEHAMVALNGRPAKFLAIIM